jgi:hypothetical protein
MRLVRVIGVCVAAAMMCGCSAVPPMESLGQEYADADHGPVDIGNRLSESYEVWLHPTKPKILVQPSLRSAMNIGIRQGITLGLGDSAPPQARFQQAAATFLNLRKGRGCSLSNPVETRNTVWEFDYVCPDPTAKRR